MTRLLAVDIGGTMLKIAETTPEGEVLSTYEEATEAKLGGQHVMKKVKKMIEQYEGYEAIGISTAGQVDSQKGEIIYANQNIPNYTGMKVKALLEEAFKVPVSVENDVNAAALGEAIYGAGKDDKDFLCLTYGTGIGGAIIINHNLYKGADGVAGEFGHMIMHPEGRACACGFNGCYEQYASTTALIRKATGIDMTCVNGRLLFEKIAEGDQALKGVLDAWIDEIVLGLVGLTHIFNPSCFILGGGIMEQDYILRAIRRKLPEHLMESFNGVHVKRASLGNRAGILGATYLANQALNR